MQEIHAARLIKLANFLKKLNKKNYTHNAYYEFENKPLSTEELILSLESMDDRFKACAAGWCPVVFKDDWTINVSAPYIVPHLKNITTSISWYIELFFDIDLQEASSIFHHLLMIKDRTPQDVAKIIEDIVQQNGFRLDVVNF